TQLRLSGKLDAAAGVVFGECNACRPRDYKPSFESTLSLGEALDEILGKLRIPVLSGLTFGHTDDQLTLPLGAMATLDADKGELGMEEAGVVYGLIELRALLLAVGDRRTRLPSAGRAARGVI